MQRNADVLSDVADAVFGHFHYGHILYDECIGSGILDIKHLPVGCLKFIIIKDCVQSDEYSRSVFVRMFAEGAYL